MTESLKDQFISQTNLSLTDANGDLQFEGEIIEYKVKPISIQANETAAQNRLTISVKVTFTNNLMKIKTTLNHFRTMLILTARKTFRL